MKLRHIEELGVSPFPWHFEARKGKTVLCSKQDLGIVDTTHTGNSDARLIAHAPELYEYLVRTVGQLEYTLDWCTGISEAAENNARRVADNARAVIVAASGEVRP